MSVVSPTSGNSNEALGVLISKIMFPVVDKFLCYLGKKKKGANLELGANYDLD